MRDFLLGLLHANLVAAGARLVVLSLRGALRNVFGAGVAYRLWAIAPIAVLASMLPGLPHAVAPALTQVVAKPWEAAVAWGQSGAGSDNRPMLFVLIWAAGAVASFGLLLRRQQRFDRAARNGLAGPAVVGAFRPKIVLPGDFTTRFTPAERHLILAHEHAHLSRRDTLGAGLVAALQCLCWFNPLVHVAAHRLRLDQELACDDDVMARFPQQRRTYAEAMMKSQLAPIALPLGCARPTRSTHALEERIAMLTKPRLDRRRRVIGAALVAALSLGSACATDLQPATAVAAPATGASGLTMRLIDDRADPATRPQAARVASPDGDLWLEREVPITGAMVSSAVANIDPDGRPIVKFALTPAGKSRFAELTRQNIGRRIAVLVDDKVVFAPVIRSQILNGSGEISGHFSVAEAKALAAAIAPPANP
jgi:beta-lactamase regulating signal transducer with metallopeptidase domain